MNANFTSSISVLAFLAICFWPSNSLAQNNIPVTVSNFTFDPVVVLVFVGDQVTWTNTSGTHNVNGFSADFPGNPEEFGNPSDGSGNWSYSHTFNATGTYVYQCGVHGTTMPGSVIVEDPNGIEDITGVQAELELIPNPSNGAFSIQHEGGIGAVAIYNAAGQVVTNANGGSSLNLNLNLQGLESGTYYCVMQNDAGVVLHRKLVIAE